MRVRWSRVVLFFAATFAMTHALTIAYVLSGGIWGTPGSFAVANLLMLCPGAVALALQRLAYRERMTEPLGLRFRPNGWFLVAWLLPPLVMLAALGFSLLLPGARYSPAMGGLHAEMASFRARVAGAGLPPIGAMLLLGLAMGPTANAIGGLGEELGWRGFLYEDLATLGFWRASAVTGGLWALWHVPLLFEGYADRDAPLASAAGTLAFALAAAPLFHVVRSRSRSVVACGVMHGTLGSTRLVSTAFVEGAGPWIHAAIPLALVVTTGALVALGQHREAAGASGR